MFFKRLLRYSSIPLVLGAILILGFLSFSGMYALVPILGLAVTAFVLSVIFEGEIFYQNINKAIKSLTKPRYIESKLGEECLKEAVKNIYEDYELIKSIDEFLELIKNLNNDAKTLREHYQKITELLNHRRINSNFKAIRSLLINIDNEYLEVFINKWDNNRIKSKKYLPGITFGKQNTPQDIISETKTKLQEFRKELITALNIPSFFVDYSRVALLHHAFAHINPNAEAQKRKENLEVSLNILDEVFTEQLFAVKDIKDNHQKQSPYKLSPANKKGSIGIPELCPDEEQSNFRGLTAESIVLAKLMDPAVKPREVEPRESQENHKEEDVYSYKEELRKYLEENYQAKYLAKLPYRKKGYLFIRILSSICGCFMILGTSYLLVEAFAVLPILAAIPYAILPAVVIPLAVLAGVAYAIQTYQALNELLNSDLITKRIAKIKEDISNGLNLYTSFKLLCFTLLLGLAITLTICTAGTWYTVVRHTKPIFSWLSKIPAAVSGIIATILAIAAFVFNLSNSAQTSEELEEAFESEVPEDHPYNINLIEIPEDTDVEKAITNKNRTTIVKQGEKYFIHCRTKNQDKGEEKWHCVQVSDNSYFLRVLLNRLNFKNQVLYYSVFNSSLYNLIRNETAHKFNPSKENWTQFLNPFRIFLLFTYIPLRIILFLGHLASISATADRVPGITEAISMLIGFVAELFEDLHYFTSFANTHKTDIVSIIDERFSEGGGCEHDNDLPTRVLRDYIFAPIFWCAAAWHSVYSNKKEVVDKLNMSSEQVPSTSFEDALDLMQGKQPKSNPQLQPSEDEFLTNIEANINESIQHNPQIAKEDLANNSECQQSLVDSIIKSRHKITDFSIFAGKKSCLCHPASTRANMLQV